MPAPECIRSRHEQREEEKWREESEAETLREVNSEEGICQDPHKDEIPASGDF